MTLPPFSPNATDQEGASAMKRCPHVRVEYVEEIDAWSQWYFENGQLVEPEGTSDGRPTGGLWVNCLDCEKKFRFGPHSKRPAWVKRLASVITNRLFSPYPERD